MPKWQPWCEVSNVLPYIELEGIVGNIHLFG